MRLIRVFNNLGWIKIRYAACLFKGMTLSLILIAAQILAAVFALVRESGEDPRFEGDKLTYRS